MLEMLRDCARASSGENGALDYHYQQAVERLQSSPIWKKVIVNVQQWINNNWLKILQA